MLFRYVDKDSEPQDVNGFDVVPSVEAIKKNIQFLHKHVLGERLELSDPEIQRTYDLFLQTWREGKEGMADEAKKDQYPTALPGPCRVERDFWTDKDLPEDQRLTEDEKYTVRAWMSVTTYLLSDYAFIYE